MSPIPIIHDIGHLVGLSDEQLANYDIAAMNLACALDLPGSEGLQISDCLNQLDHWAELVRVGTQNLWSRFPHYQREWGATEAQFRIWVMITVLQRNLNVRYNLSCSDDPIDCSDSRTDFIHGILLGEGGTCVSLPVLYVAIGRRLAYPLWLVEAREHFFVRWEDNDERFNIEATSPGFEPLDDQHFHHRPKPMLQRDLELGLLLTNLTPREELAHFLSSRGHCLLDNLRAGFAMNCFYHAGKIAPRIRHMFETHWAVSTMMHTLIENMRRNTHRQCDYGYNLDKFVQACLPTPQSVRDHQMISIVSQEFRRIADIHKRRGYPMQLQATPGFQTIPGRWR